MYFYFVTNTKSKKMNLNKVTVLLEKVNALHKSIQLGGDATSKIERDLMLSYLRQLYELFHDQTETPAATSNFEPEVVRKPVEQPKPKIEPIITPPRIIEIPDTIKEELTRPVKPFVQEIPTPPVKTFQEPVAPKEVPRPVPVETPIAENAIAALFDQKQAKELSEKLSNARIEDLTRSISLNDKMLYANELFNEDLVAFNEVVRTINNMATFADAQRYLVQLARQYDWVTETKQESAKNFIKLVRRRF
jgi:hypothetical protein